MTTKKKVRVLVAEDDDEFRAALSEELQRAGYEITACRHGMDLLRELRSLDTPAQPEEFDLIVSDIRMPGVTGLSVLAGLSEIENTPPIILITAFGDQQTHAEAQRLGAAAILDKPFAMADLLTKIRDVTSSCRSR